MQSHRRRPAQANKHAYRRYQQQRRRQAILALGAMAIVVSLGLGVKALWPKPSTADGSLVERALERHFPMHAYNNWLYGTFLGDFASKPGAEQKLLPLMTSVEDSALKDQLAALFASYSDVFTPYLYYYDPQDGTYVQFRGYEPVPAASVIKLPVLLAYFNHVDRNIMRFDSPVVYMEIHRAGGAGGLQYGPSGQVFPANEMARQMIQLSDNTATNIMISYLGGSGLVNQQLQDMGLRKTHINNWLPDLEGTNKISMYEMATILQNIQTSPMMSEQSRMQALEILKGTRNRRLLPALLPEGTEIAHKTGDIGTALGDAGMIYLPNGQHYVLSMQVTRPFNDYTARDIIQKASQIIYNHQIAKLAQQETSQQLVLETH